MKKYIKFIFITILTYSSLFAAQSGQQYLENESETFTKAVKYYFQQKFDMAELLLQQELRTNAENQLAYSYLGDIFLYRKRYESAITLFKKSLELNPKNAKDNYSLGQCYYYKDLPNSAISHFIAAYNIDSSEKETIYWVGLTYLKKLRDKQNTIMYWEKYLEIAPESPQYEKIKRVLELLKDPNFEIPPIGSDISIEEALFLGGETLKGTERKNDDKGAGHEDKKTVNKNQDIYRDDDL